jgi:uncharacterized membrane protein
LKFGVTVLKNDRLQKLIMTALFAAMVCVATAAVHIPIPAVNGYVNPGDCLVLLSAFILGPVYGMAAAGIGSAFADIFLGYAVFAPGTLVIKGLCALTASLIMRKFYEKLKFASVIAAFIGELIMIAGYFFYESVILRFGLAALGSVAANAAQGVFGAVSAVLIYRALKNVPAIRKLQNKKG